MSDIASGRANRAALAVAGLLGVAAALAVAAQSGAEAPTSPCQGNGDATTIQKKTYTGSNGPDIIQANDKDNVIYGRGGGDTICSYSGKDTVYGGRGGDDLWGEDNNDDLFGGRKADTLRGGNGANDKCVGGRPTADGQSTNPDIALECERVTGAVPP